MTTRNRATDIRDVLDMHASETHFKAAGDSVRVTVSPYGLPANFILPPTHFMFVDANCEAVTAREQEFNNLKSHVIVLC